MKKEDLLHAMNDIDSRYVQDAEAGRAKSRQKKFVMAGIAAAACFCIAIGVGVLVSGRGKAISEDGVDKEEGTPTPTPSSSLQGTLPGGNTVADAPFGNFQNLTQNSIYADYAIAQANYPECAPYPDEEKIEAGSLQGEIDTLWTAWNEQRKERIEYIGQSEAYQESLYPFYRATMNELLVSDETINRTYSPLNFYMALSMLAELTDGNSRAQILALLGAPDLAAVRERAKVLWMANYSDDGMVTSILANSLWLRQGEEYTEETMRTLADVYYASAFRGEMGSEGYTQAFQAWINAQTGGLLGEQVGALSLDPSTVLALVSTIYYSAQWQDLFYENNTKEGVFHTAGGDVTFDFMHQEKYDMLYRGEGFSAIRQGLERGGNMWLFLPDEAAGVNDVAAGDGMLELLRSSVDWEDKFYAKINLAMPKFDVASEIDLVEGMQAMGITDVFDASTADFSPIKENADGLYLGEAKHASRVMVDEIGCTAAAYTMMAIDECGPATPEKEVDFVLDRPFLFAITGADGTVLFIGVVEEP